MAYKFRTFSDYMSDFDQDSQRSWTPRVNKNVSKVLSQAYVNNYSPSEDDYAKEITKREGRGLLDRAFDTLLTGNYMSAGFVDGALKQMRGESDDPWIAWKQAWDGYKSGLGSLFTNGDEDGEYTYSKVLENSGWKPESMVGKVAKGATGFALDVLLDPSTYLSGGGTALIKGTGKKMQEGLTRRAVEELGVEEAKGIISRQAGQRGVKMTDSELERDATTLAREVSRLRGIRDTNQKMSYGLGNAPFIGNTKLAKKLTYEFGDTSRLQKVGDKTIAPMYSKLRDSIYGSKLGNLFSTTSKLYQYSKKEPEKLYDFLKFTEYTRGQNLDKLQTEKLIRDKAKNMNLSPAEQKEVLEMLQNPSVWNKVAKTVNVLDTKEADQYKSKVASRKAELEKELSDVETRKKNIESLRYANEQELFDTNDLLGQATTEYRDALTKINTKNVEDATQLESLVKGYQDEIAKLDTPTQNKGYRTEDVQKVKELHTSSKATSAQGGVQPEKANLVDELSTMLFGEKGQISVKAYDDTLDNVMKMLEEGKSQKQVMDYVASQSDGLSGKSQDMYSYVAKKVGYKNWQEDYIKPMTEIQEKQLRGQKLTKYDTKQVAKLEQLNLKRLIELDNVRGKSHNEIKIMRRDLENEQLMKDFEDIEGIANSTAKTGLRPSAREARRAKFIDEDASSASRKTGEFDDNSTYNTNLLQSDKDEIRQELVERVISPSAGGVKISGAHVKWMNNVTDQVQILLDNMFKKEYSDLSDAQKNLLFNLAVKNSGKEAGFDAKALASKAEEIATQRADEARSLAIEKEAKQGDEVIFERVDKGVKSKKTGEESRKSTSEIWKGKIIGVAQGEDGLLNYSIQTNAGVLDNVKAGQIKELRKDGSKRTADELIAQSDVVDDVVGRKEQLVKSIDDAMNQMGKLSESASMERQYVMDKYKQQVAELKPKIVRLQEEKQAFDKAIQSDDFGEIDKLQSSIKQYEEALNDNDVLEDMIKNNLGADKVSKITTQIVSALDADASSPKVRDLVRSLRGEFMEMADKEVKMGQLNADQVNRLLMTYVPHILTSDGAEFVRRGKDITKKGTVVTQDLGYGTKWNPHKQSRTIKNIQMPDGSWVANPTIEQINESMGEVLKGKNMFSESISDIYLARAMKHTELMYDWEYMNNMMNTFGKQVKNGTVEKGYKAVANIGQVKKFIYTQSKGDGAVRQDIMNKLGISEEMLDELAVPMLELTQGQIELFGKQAPQLMRQVNDAIVGKANQARKLTIARDENRFLRMYDKFTHFMKLNQTTIMPSFHARNKYSNMYLNWLSIGRDAVNLDNQRVAFVLARYQGDPSKLKELASKNEGWKKRLAPIVQPDGTVVHWDEVYNLAKAHEVVDEGFFAKDIGAGTASKGMLGKVLPSKLDPTDTENFLPYRKGGEIGNTIENWDRLIHFSTLLKKGHSPEEAGRLANQFLFDYSDLTAFEQNVMKRIMPYYTWLRKNGRLQVSQLIDNPGKYRDTAKALNGIEGMNNEEDRVNPAFLSNFAKDWVQTPFNTQEGEPVLLNPNMPFMDLARIPDPSQPVQSAKELFTQTVPQIKVPVEQALNKNVFFDAPIVEKDEEGNAIGNPVAERADHVGSQFAYYTFIRDLINKGEGDKARHLLNATSGVKTLGYNYKASKYDKIDEVKDAEGLESSASVDFDGLRKMVDQLEPTPDSDEGIVEQLKSKIMRGTLTDQEKEQYADFIESYKEVLDRQARNNLIDMGIFDEEGNVMK